MLYHAYTIVIYSCQLWAMPIWHKSWCFELIAFFFKKHWKTFASRYGANDTQQMNHTFVKHAVAMIFQIIK